MRYTIQVGYSNHRPIVPDEHTSWVTTEADSFCEASLIAAQMVVSRIRVGMVTSTRPYRPAVVTWWPVRM